MKMFQTCKICEFWTRIVEREHNLVKEIIIPTQNGKCSCEKFISPPTKCGPIDGFFFWDDDSGGNGDFETGEHFGCIHFQERKKQ